MRRSGVGEVDAGVGERFLQFARFVHFTDDIAAANKLALNVELRNGRPVGKLLDAFAHFRVGQHVAIVWVRNLIGHLGEERRQRDDIIAEQTQELTREIEERKKSQEELRRLSDTDELTNTFNRRSFNKALTTEISRAARYQEPFSIVMLDLDKFKSINDTHGHDAGDQVLISFADHVKGHLRDTDTFARFGGEEFVVLMPHTLATSAVSTAERIRSGVEAMDIPIADGIISVSVSIGIAQYTPQDAPRAAELLKKADDALYEAKHTGRNRCVIAS